MREIRITLSDAEFRKIEDFKKSLKLTWRDFIIELIKNVNPNP